MAVCKRCDKFKRIEEKREVEKRGDERRGEVKRSREMEEEERGKMSNEGRRREEE